MLLARILRIQTFNTTKNVGFVSTYHKIHTSPLFLGTHDYEAVKVTLPQEKLQEISSNLNVFKQLSRKTGVVARWVNTDGNILLDGDSEQVLLVGASRQVKRAMEILQRTGDKEQDQIKEGNTSAPNTKLIWHGYKRNFKGQYPPEKPRRQCIRCGGKMISGNPCPLCQLQMSSDYNIHYTDTELLKQFICPYTWNLLDPSITGLCRKQHRLVEAAVKKSRLHGLLPFTLPLPSKEVKKHTPAGVPTDRKIKVKMH